jgi:sporulation protein YlmC with PRC-barrel domain
MLIRRIRMQTTFDSELHKDNDMNTKIRNAILAGAIAAVISAPTFAAEGVQYGNSSDAPDKTGSDMPMHNQSTTGDSMDKQQNMGDKSTDTAGKTGSDMPMHNQSTTGDSMDKQQNMGYKSTDTAAKNPVKDNPIYSRSAESLDGVEIVDAAGKKIGTIKSVVLAKDRRSAHAVVSTGGIMGVGARDILVSLDELTTVDDKLQMTIDQEQLEARQEYQSEQYVELEGDKPIDGAMSEFSAFETEDKSQDPTLAPVAPESVK